MRNYSKTGGRRGMPGYRTQASFRQKVLDVVKGIPKGKTLTYKEVANLAQSPKAYRAVGNILNKNYDPKIPCHRVIRADGSFGGYNRGVRRKKELLEKECESRKVVLKYKQPRVFREPVS